MNINTNMSNDRKWFVYRVVGKSKPTIEKHPCTFEEALQKAWEERQLIDANDKRSQR
jgi:hypothetical protein